MDYVLDKLNDAHGLTIAVIGDIMLDRYIYGDALRLSFEAPVPVVTVTKETETLGGSGNVIVNLRGIKVNVLPIGIVGNDVAGRKVLDLIETLDCLSEYLILSNHQTTTLKTRIIANNQQLARIDWDHLVPSDRDKRKIKQYVAQSLETADVAIISDYNKGICTPEIVQYAIQRAKSLRIPIFIDPKGKDFFKYRGATCIKPNKQEAQDILPFEIHSEESFEKAIDWIRDQFEIDVCVITRGKDGMVYSESEGVTFLSTYAKEVFDVSGAGDTVIAVLATCIGLGLDYETSTRIANIAAGIVVAYPGTYPIEIESLRDKIKLNFQKNS